MKTQRFVRNAMLIFVSCFFLPPAAQAMPRVGPDWILAHIDIETTGPIPGYHELVDIGIVYTDLDGNVLEKFYRKIMPEHLDRVDPGAVRVDGFNPEVWREHNAVSAEEALKALLRFERAHFSAAEANVHLYRALLATAKQDAERNPLCRVTITEFRTSS